MVAGLSPLLKAWAAFSLNPRRHLWRALLIRWNVVNSTRTRYLCASTRRRRNKFRYDLRDRGNLLQNVGRRVANDFRDISLLNCGGFLCVCNLITATARLRKLPYYSASTCDWPCQSRLNDVVWHNPANTFTFSRQRFKIIVATISFFPSEKFRPDKESYLRNGPKKHALSSLGLCCCLTDDDDSDDKSGVGHLAFLKILACSLWFSFGSSLVWVYFVTYRPILCYVLLFSVIQTTPTTIHRLNLTLDLTTDVKSRDQRGLK